MGFKYEKRNILIDIESLGQNDEFKRILGYINTDINKQLKGVGGVLSDFFKQNKDDVIYWIEDLERVGYHLFSFDKKKIYNLFKDYPHNLKVEEKEIFDRENPYWVNYFKDRSSK